MPLSSSWQDRPGLIGLAAGVGAIVAGVIGAVVGLVVGLLVHPPTAWFAVIELGLPAAFLGGAVGLLAGLGIRATRRITLR